MRTLALLAICALLAACDKKNDSPTPAASASTPTVTSATVADTDVPSEEDFEDEAEKDITPDTLEQQLAAMEKEVDTP